MGGCVVAGSEKLNNLTMIVDDNHSLKEMLDIGSFTQKLETFGFEVENVDGHSEEALFQAFTKVRTENRGQLLQIQYEDMDLKPL